MTNLVIKDVCPFCEGEGCERCGFLGNIDPDVAAALYEEINEMADLECINHPRIIFADKINLMSSFGRAKTNNLKSDRQSPVCFNLRSIAGNLNNFSEAVMTLRMSGKMCTPSIDVKGKDGE